MLWNWRTLGYQSGIIYLEFRGKSSCCRMRVSIPAELLRSVEDLITLAPLWDTVDHYLPQDTAFQGLKMSCEIALVSTNFPLFAEKVLCYSFLRTLLCFMSVFCSSTHVFRVHYDHLSVYVSFSPLCCILCGLMSCLSCEGSSRAYACQSMCCVALHVD